MGANPAGNSPEGISSAWEKSLGSTCAPAVGDGLEHPHLGQRKLPREPVVQLFSRQLRTPAVLQHGCPKSNNFTTRRCRISMIQNPMAPRSGGASSRRFSPRQLRTPAVLQLGGLQSNSATIRRCCIPVVQNPMAPCFGGASSRRFLARQLSTPAVLQLGGSQSNSATIRRCRIPEFAIR